MSYNPTNWTSGDIITSTKLNKIEQGIADAAESGGGVLRVNTSVDGNYLVADKTALEIKTAWLSGKQVIFKINSNDIENEGNGEEETQQ